MPAYTEQQRNYWMSAFACGPPVGPPPALAEFGLTVGATAKWYSSTLRRDHRRGRTRAAWCSADAGTISRVWKVDSDSFRFNSESAATSRDGPTANQTAQIVITTPYGVGTLLTWRTTQEQRHVVDEPRSRQRRSLRFLTRLFSWTRSR